MVDPSFFVKNHKEMLKEIVIIGVSFTQVQKEVLMSLAKKHSIEIYLISSNQDFLDKSSSFKEKVEDLQKEILEYDIEEFKARLESLEDIEETFFNDCDFVHTFFLSGKIYGDSILVRSDKEMPEV